MTIRARGLSLALCIVGCAACAPAPTQVPPGTPARTPPPAAPAPAPAPPAAAPSPAPPAWLDLAGMDRAVAPGDDFFRFANGVWIKRHEIPPDRSSFGTGAILAELTARRTAELIAGAAQTPGPPGSDSQRIGDYYASFMDEAGIEAKGLHPLEPTLDRIAAIKDRAGLARALGASLRADVDVLNATKVDTDNLFGLWVAQDLSTPSRYSPFLLQGGLGMPDREYYLDPSPRMAAIRTQYEAHVAAVLRLAGVADPAPKAARIVDLERRIALAHATRVETEDVEKGNNHWRRTDFRRRAPGLDWTAFFAAAGLAKQDELVVWQPKAVTGIAALVGSQPLAVWREYLTFHAIEHVATFLPAAFVQEWFAFHGKVLTGTPQLRDRWNAAAGAIIGHEISHSFDDQGALFDASGRLANWWTKEDFAHFKASSTKLVRQYDRYRPLPDLGVNGTLTLSENIADLAGLPAAYGAYRLAHGGQEAPSVHGLTGDQLFFVSFAQSWRQKMREAALRRRILTDGHAPAEYRADTVRNLDAWYAAFTVRPGQALYLAPAERVQVW
ncbi:MAG TPA: M13 family metallopeptidase [Polyangia bacterium]|jgi:predicted metalloendopeptidase